MVKQHNILALLLLALLISCGSEEQPEQRTTFKGKSATATFKAASSSTLTFTPTTINAVMNPSAAPGNFFVNLEATTASKMTNVHVSSNSGLPTLNTVYTLTPSTAADSRLSRTYTNPDVQLSVSAVESKSAGKNMWEETTNLQLTKAQLRFTQFDSTGAFAIDLSFRFSNGRVLAGRVSGTAGMAEGAQCDKAPEKRTGFNLEGKSETCWAQQCDNVMCTAIYRQGTNEFETACRQRGQLVSCGCFNLCSVNVGSFGSAGF